MRYFTLAAVAASLMAMPANAQDPGDPPAIEPLAIQFGEGGLAGPGAAPLEAELAQAQFVSIGEDHGFADAPRLVTAISIEGATYGFDTYAIEVGPYSTRWLSDVLADGGADGLAQQLEGIPLSVPFLNMREEAHAASLFLEQGRVWGWDQEFIGSPLIHFAELQEGASEEARRMLEGLLVTEREAFQTGNQAAVFFMAGTPEQWAELREVFAADSQKLARLDALERSAKIYGHYLRGRGLDNNLDRVALIRETFLEAYHTARRSEGEPPKVILKGGSTHAGRSTSAMATFDLGSLLEGMAAANAMDVLHLAYLPLGGEQIATMPSADGPFTIRPVDAGKLRAALEQAGVNLAPVDAGEGHFVIPMEPVKRALRNKGLQALDPMTRFTVLGYDYLITTAKGRPATPLVER